MDVTARISSSIELASDTPAHVTTQPGGSAANTAAWMAATGHESWFVGCVGDDAFGREIRSMFDAVGVRSVLAVSRARPTGTCVIIVDDKRERTMFPDKGANDELDDQALHNLKLGPGDHLHMSAYVLLNPNTQVVGRRMLDYASESGATTSLDAASAGPLRADRDAILADLRLITVLIANEDEAVVLSGSEDVDESLRMLATLVSTVVIKRGSHGVIARSSGSSVAQVGLPAEVVDTTGAGDAFAAAFLSTWLTSGDLAAAVSAGQVLAVGSVSRVGASPLTR